MKLAVLGGGGVRSMFLAKSLANRAKELGIRTLVFQDIDSEKLRIFGNMARIVAAKIDANVEFVLTESAQDAVRDADYVITTMRVGGDTMRVRDERIALSHGVLGQETTGGAGLSFAMRSVPALAEYMELVKRYAKRGAKVFNFTNPAGVVSQTLRDMGYDFTYGICDAPSGMLHSFAEYYGVEPNRVTGDCFGLNHLSYMRVKLDGEDITQRILSDDKLIACSDLRFFDKELLSKIGLVPNEYLYYFYYREQAVENILRAGYTRGEDICETNRHMLDELRALDVERDFDTALAVFDKWYGRREARYMANETGIARPAREWHFDIYSHDDGGYAGVALRFIDIQRSGSRGSMILCTRNDGALDILQPEDIVEVTCDIDETGATARRFSEIPPLPAMLIRRVKEYERLSSLALRTRSFDTLVDALTVHPLVNSYSLARAMAAEYAELNRDYIQMR